MLPSLSLVLWQLKAYEVTVGYHLAADKLALRQVDHSSRHQW